MPAITIPRHRLSNQHLARAKFASPSEVVAWLGAVQAQDYLGALWGVGLRMKTAVEADVERALSAGTIVRSWPLRGTLHFTAAEDLRWMLDLLAPRVMARHSSRLERDFEVDAATLRRSRTAVIKALRDGHALTRGLLYATLERAGIRTTASRGLHIVFRLAHEKLILFGPRQRKQQTFVLFDEWIRSSTPLKGDEALHELARRYFTTRERATAVDFAWWSGLTLTEAKRGAEMVSAKRVRSDPSQSAVLLPAFDEYLVAYKDRSAFIDPAFAKRVNAGGGILKPTIVIDGLVVGTWKRTLTKDAVIIAPELFRALKTKEKRMYRAAAERYASFLGRRLG